MKQWSLLFEPLNFCIAAKLLFPFWFLMRIALQLIKLFSMALDPRTLFDAVVKKLKLNIIEEIDSFINKSFYNYLRASRPVPDAVLPLSAPFGS